MYDMCIVGAGMIGSAAARHATRTSGLRVCLIGPAERKKRSAEQERDIYGSYYDEGRITLSADTDIIWARLAQESIKRYRHLENQSGIGFYYEVGNLLLGGGNSDVLQKTDQVLSESGHTAVKLDNKSLRDQYPYLRLNKDVRGIIELHNAGYINPRKLVEAQKKMAVKQGCTVIDDVVCHVFRTVQSDETYAMRVETEGGRVIESNTVLLATGAFTALRDLLPGIKHDHYVKPLSISFLEVHGNELQTLREMPCVAYYGSANEVWQMPPTHERSENIFFYMLPPIKYPDGRYYIKLGLGDAVPGRLTTSADVKQWFTTGDRQIGEDVAKLMASLFQGVKFKSWTCDSCAKTITPTSRPYIDMVHGQLGVAVGGNGYAAKSSDEIGRLAVSLVLAGWDTDLPREAFRLRTSSDSNTATVAGAKAKL